LQIHSGGRCGGGYTSLRMVRCGDGGGLAHGLYERQGKSETARERERERPKSY